MSRGVFFTFLKILVWIKTINVWVTQRKEPPATRHKGQLWMFIGGWCWWSWSMTACLCSKDKDSGELVGFFCFLPSSLSLTCLPTGLMVYFCFFQFALTERSLFGHQFLGFSAVPSLFGLSGSPVVRWCFSVLNSNLHGQTIRHHYDFLYMKTQIIAVTVSAEERCNSAQTSAEKVIHWWWNEVYLICPNADLKHKDRPLVWNPGPEIHSSPCTRLKLRLAWETWR